MQLSGGQAGRALLQPNIYLYMPHLQLHPDSLVPNVVLGQGRRGGTELSLINTAIKTPNFAIVKPLWLLEFQDLMFPLKDKLI